jgi:hypothetical protein
MFDVYIDNPAFNERKVVDGFAGFVELLLLADREGTVGIDGNIVFTVRDVQGRLKCLCRLQRGTVWIAYLAGCTGFEGELRCAGLTVISQ